MQYVYLIKCNSQPEYYKVGIAMDVENRLAQLQTGSPFELTIEECYGFDNAEIVERAIHQAWKNARVRGEWFDKIDVHDLFNQICSTLGGEIFVPENYEANDDEVEEAEHNYILVNGANWRLEARNDRQVPGYAIMKRGGDKVYLGYIKGCDLEDPNNPTVEEVEAFLKGVIAMTTNELKPR